MMAMKTLQHVLMKLKRLTTKSKKEIKLKLKDLRGKGLLSYFSSEGCGSSNMGKENGPKRRKVQVNKYFCIYENCHKIIARANKYTTERHAERWHENDKSYNCMTDLLPLDHHKVVAIRKINKNQTAKGQGSVSLIDSSNVSDNDDESDDNQSIHDDDAGTSPQITEQNNWMAPGDEFEITYKESVDKNSVADQKEPSVQSTISFERLNRDMALLNRGGCVMIN